MVEIDLNEFQDFISKKTLYYKSIRTALDQLDENDNDNVKYVVLEYDRDLTTPHGVLRTLQRLQSALQLPVTEESNMNALVQQWSNQRGHSSHHHERLSFRQRISNWQQLVDAGYGDKDDTNWPDLFAE